MTSTIVHHLPWICLVINLVSSLNVVSYERSATLGGKICQASDDIVFSIQNIGYGQKGHILCAERCSIHAECVSIFYDSAKSTCTGCRSVSHDTAVGTVYYRANARELVLNYRPGNHVTNVYDLMSVQDGRTHAGTGFYEASCLSGENKCIESNQECFKDTCVCSPGYSYNPSNNTCVDRCDTYGTTFQRYEGRRINGDNLYTLHGISQTDCMNECLSNAQCLSFEHKTNLCNIQGVTPLTTVTFFEVASAFTYFGRDCA